MSILGSSQMKKIPLVCALALATVLALAGQAVADGKITYFQTDTPEFKVAAVAIEKVDRPATIEV